MMSDDDGKRICWDDEFHREEYSTVNWPALMPAVAMAVVLTISFQKE